MLIFGRALMRSYNSNFWYKSFFVRMIKIITVILILAISLKSKGQTMPVITDTSYTAGNGMTFFIGDDIKIGKGTLRYNKRDYFTYIYTAPWTFPRGGHLDQYYSGKLLKIKKIRIIGNGKRGYKVILICGSGDMVHWWIEIEDAIKSGEVLIPGESPENKK
jgi:hypothetical protein